MTNYKVTILKILRERALENTAGRVSAALDILGYADLSTRLQHRAERVEFESTNFKKLDAAAEALRPAFPADVDDNAEEAAASEALLKLRGQEDLLRAIELEISEIADSLEAEISAPVA